MPRQKGGFVFKPNYGNFRQEKTKIKISQPIKNTRTKVKREVSRKNFDEFSNLELSFQRDISKKWDCSS